jgi:hypothetical protein
MTSRLGRCHARPALRDRRHLPPGGDRRRSGLLDSRPVALPSTLPHSVGGTLVLLVVQVLNVYKPQGLTPYGWRKLEVDRKRYNHDRFAPKVYGSSATSHEDAPK